MRAGLPALPGARLKLGGDDENEGASRLSVRLFGDPGPRMASLAEEVRRRIARVPGLTDVEVGGDQGRHEVEVTVAREMTKLRIAEVAEIAEGMVA